MSTFEDYQTCPVCAGTGLVSRPPWIAGDVTTWVSCRTDPYECKTCRGLGILSKQTAMTKQEI